MSSWQYSCGELWRMYMRSAHVHDTYSFSAHPMHCELNTWHGVLVAQTTPATHRALLEEMAYFSSASGGVYESVASSPVVATVQRAMRPRRA